MAGNTIPDPVRDDILNMSMVELISENTLDMIYSPENDMIRRQELLAAVLSRAKELKCAKSFDKFKKTYLVSLAIKNEDGCNTTSFPEQSIELRCGSWICDETGVRRNQFVAANGEYVMKYASPQPVTITEILENVDDGLVRVRVEFFTGGVWKSAVCASSTISSNTKIIELADQGLGVNSINAKLLVEYLGDIMRMNADIIPRRLSAGHLGWHGGDFIPYTGDIAFDGDMESRALYECIEGRGSYEGWVRHTHELRKNLYLRLQMAASFASPLLEKISALPFVLNLWGGTGSGKTVGLMTAMSVWGDPAPGRLVKTMNMTVNAMMMTAGFLKNIPFAGDELQTIKNNVGYDKLIMQVTEGVGRGRMKYDAIQKTETWSCAFLFTAEEPCTGDGSGGGVKNRVIDLECKGSVVDNGARTADFLRKNYGLAGKKYIGHINGARNLFERYQRHFTALLECDTTEKQAMAMACMLLGDELACECIYTDEKPLEVADVAGLLRTKSEVDVSERAYDFIVSHIAANAARFYEDTGGELWGKIDEEVVFINKTILVRELSAAGFSFDTVKAKWAETGRIFRNSQGKFVHYRTVNGVRSLFVKLLIPSQDEERNTAEPPF